MLRPTTLLAAAKMSTTSAQPLVFYDIPNLLPDKSWSPNTWKTRYALNMKNIPYTTHWLPYREIAPEMKRIGAQPTYHAVAREHRYTLPAIFDPNTGKGIADSLAVIDYLEAAYPETVSLLPPGTHALQRSFIQVHLAPLQSSIFPLITVVCHDLVLPDYRATWREERERWTGTTLEDAAPPGEKREAVLKNVLKILDGMDAVLSTNGGSGVFVTGDTPSYCDAVLAAVFTWMRRLLTEESADWIAVMKANDGRWHRFMNAMKKWEIVH